MEPTPGGEIDWQKKYLEMDALLKVERVDADKKIRELKIQLLNEENRLCRLQSLLTMRAVLEKFEDNVIGNQLDPMALNKTRREKWELFMASNPQFKGSVQHVYPNAPPHTLDQLIPSLIVELYSKLSNEIHKFAEIQLGLDYKVKIMSDHFDLKMENLIIAICANLKHAHEFV